MLLSKRGQTVHGSELIEKGERQIHTHTRRVRNWSKIQIELKNDLSVAYKCIIQKQNQQTNICCLIDFLLAALL